MPRKIGLMLLVLISLTATSAKAAKVEVEIPVGAIERSVARLLAGTSDMLIRMFYGPMEADLSNLARRIIDAQARTPHLPIAKILSPVQLRTLQDHPVSTAAITGFSAYPSEPADWAAVFDDAHPTARQIDQARSLNTELKAKIFSSTPDHLPTDVLEFASVLETTESSIVAIVGHNENGQLVVPPNHRLDLTDMDDACDFYQKLCVFLSCKSSDRVSIGASRSLDLRDAVDIAHRLQRLSEMAASDHWNKEALMQAIVAMIQETEASQLRRYAVSRFGPPGVAGLLLYVSYDELSGNKQSDASH